MHVSLAAARRLSAVLTAAVGLMNVVSALYPAIPTRLELVRDLLPLSGIRATQTATVLAGFALILLADGLRKRRRRAFQLTLVVVVLSALLNLAKGLDFEEAIVAGWLGTFLVMNRQAFDVPSRMPVPSHWLSRIGSFILLYYGYVFAGFLILRRFIHPFPTATGAFLEPLRLLVGEPIYHYATPQSQWFGRSLSCVGSVAILAALVALLRPLIPRLAASPEDLARVRELIRRYGRDALSYFSLQDGRSYFFHRRGDAFLSYRLWGNVALVAGDPVGAPHLLGELVDDFLDFCHDSSIDPCFLGVSSGHLPMYISSGLKTLKIGEEAVIDLPEFASSSLKRKVRRAARHVEDLGIHVETYRRGEIPLGILDQLGAISQRWVDLKGGTERGFSMTLGRLPREDDADCEVTVAVEGGRVWGFLVFAPVYGSRGWSLDSMRRLPDSPNGLMECLVIHAAEMYRDRGYSTLSLNFATLSNSEDDIESRAIEGTRRFLFEHLSNYYQLKSLYQFNSKFLPRWQSRYMAYSDVLKLPKVALAVVQSEDPVRIPSVVGVFRR